MRIQNLKDPQAGVAASPGAATALRGVSAADEAAAARVIDYPTPERPAQDRQTLEIAFLKARIQHLELVIETARNLMGSNQERLLRRLYEVPREMAELSAQLRRIDPHAAC